MSSARAAKPVKGANPKAVVDKFGNCGKSPGNPEYGYKACRHICNLIPTNVPGPDCTQRILHPRKDVFVLKVSKVGPNGDRRSKMELELVTPKYNDRRAPYRVDTREAQCDPDPPPCHCCGKQKRKKAK